MPYALYGKWVAPHKNEYGDTIPPDKQFKPLNRHGTRCTSLKFAVLFDTREQAKEVLSKINLKEGTKVEIRKVKVKD